MKLGFKQNIHFLGEEIKQKWMLEPVHYVATLLHPHFKKFGDDDASQKLAVQYLCDMIDRRRSLPGYLNSANSFTVNSTTTTNDFTSLIPANATMNKNVLSLCIDKSSKPSASTNEVDEWLRSSPTLDDNNVLLF